MPKNYLIWSEEHGGWWRADRHGYTRSIRQAGRYSKITAEEIVKNANYGRDLDSQRPFNEIALPEPEMPYETLRKS